VARCAPPGARCVWHATSDRPVVLEVYSHEATLCPSGRPRAGPQCPAASAPQHAHCASPPVCAGAAAAWQLRLPHLPFAGRCAARCGLTGAAEGVTGAAACGCCCCRQQLMCRRRTLRPARVWGATTYVWGRACVAGGCATRDNARECVCVYVCVCAVEQHARRRWRVSAAMLGVAVCVRVCGRSGVLRWRAAAQRRHRARCVSAAARAWGAVCRNPSAVAMVICMRGLTW
jgi:hypothetical protein